MELLEKFRKKFRKCKKGKKGLTGVWGFDRMVSKLDLVFRGQHEVPNPS